jgi:hypothetical protein
VLLLRLLLPLLPLLALLPLLLHPRLLRLPHSLCPWISRLVQQTKVGLNG